MWILSPAASAFAPEPAFATADTKSKEHAPGNATHSSGGCTTLFLFEAVDVKENNVKVDAGSSRSRAPGMGPRGVNRWVQLGLRSEREGLGSSKQLKGYRQRASALRTFPVMAMAIVHVHATSRSISNAF